MTTMAQAAPPAGLDKVTSVEPGFEAVGVRAVPGTLDLFDSHFPRFPVLPGVLLVQAMAQMSAVALGGADGWVLDSVQAVRFRHAVRPGDVAVVTARVLDSGPDGACCSATVTVDGRAVVTARRLYLGRVPALSSTDTREGGSA
jgi:3-hydroxyacyl-[acyl-carrier-protein] dehydratase